MDLTPLEIAQLVPEALALGGALGILIVIGRWLKG